MKKLTDMTGEELTRWYREHPSMYADETFAILRDRIVAECAANLAEAERDIARKAWNAARDVAIAAVAPHTKMDEAYNRMSAERDAYLDRHYPAPAPEGVTLICVVCGLSDKGVAFGHTINGEAAHRDYGECIGALGAALRAKVGAT